MEASHCSELFQGRNDWSNHLSGTIVFSSSKDKVTPLYVRGIGRLDYDDEDNEPVYLSDLSLACYSIKGNYLERTTVSGSSVLTGFPPLGMADSKGTTTLTYNYYTQRRQFKKSLNASVVEGHVPLPLLDMDRTGAYVVGDSTAGGLISLEQMLNKEYALVENAYESLMRLERHSLALSRGFGIWASPYSQYPILQYESMVVGEVQEGKAYIQEAYSSVVEEYMEDVSNEVTIYE